MSNRLLAPGPHLFDWKVVLAALKQELRQMANEKPPLSRGLSSVVLRLTHRSILRGLYLLLRRRRSEPYPSPGPPDLQLRSLRRQSFYRAFLDLAFDFGAGAFNAILIHSCLLLLLRD